MVHDKWSLQQGRDSNSRPLEHESSPLPLDHGVLPNGGGGTYVGTIPSRFSARTIIAHFHFLVKEIVYQRNAFKIEMQSNN